MLPSSPFGASYGFGAPYNSFGAAYGSGSPYFGLGGGYGAGFGAGGGYGAGYGGYRYGNYLATTYGGNSAATGAAARFYYGAPGGNGGFGYGPGGYGNNDNSTYRYRGTSALPPVPAFDNYAQPSPLVPYSYIYANQRTPQAPAHPETISNPFVSQAHNQEAPMPMPPADEPPQRKAD